MWWYRVADLVGDGVNLAARLQEVAAPGGIAMSEASHVHLKGNSDVAFVEGGSCILKNIAEPVPVCLWRLETAPVLSESGLDDGRCALPSVAVLPFDNISASPEQAFFADGMAEDVINALSNFRWLFVIARGTTFGYKG